MLEVSQCLFQVVVYYYLQTFKVLNFDVYKIPRCNQLKEVGEIS